MSGLKSKILKVVCGVVCVLGMANRQAQAITVDLLGTAIAWDFVSDGPLMGSRSVGANDGASGLFAVPEDGSWDDPDPGLTVAFKVELLSGPARYRYSYTITGMNSKNVSHASLLVSEDFGIDEDVIASSGSLVSGDSSFAGAKFGGLTTGFSVLKFDAETSEGETYFVETKRVPMHGLFYAKDGTDSSDDTTGWSSGWFPSRLLPPPPMEFLEAWSSRVDLGPSDNPLHFLPVPDTDMLIVPLPSATWMGLSVLGGLAMMRAVRGRRLA